MTLRRFSLLPAVPDHALHECPATGQRLVAMVVLPVLLLLLVLLVLLVQLLVLCAMLAPVQAQCWLPVHHCSLVWRWKP